MTDNEQTEPADEWYTLPAEPVPKPTAWPATMALAITFLFWGLASTIIISGVGAVVFAFALTGWIGNIRHGRQH
jgi:hypothetical protein